MNPKHAEIKNSYIQEIWIVSSSMLISIFLYFKFFPAMKNSPVWQHGVVGAILGVYCGICAWIVGISCRKVVIKNDVHLVDLWGKNWSLNNNFFVSHVRMNANRLKFWIGTQSFSLDFTETDKIVLGLMMHHHPNKKYINIFAGYQSATFLAIFPSLSFLFATGSSGIWGFISCLVISNLINVMLNCVLKFSKFEQ